MKTRLAPTPSGFLHLGNLFSFALTVALARKTEALIFLRIDDLDYARKKEKFVEGIFNVLSFMQIPYDEGPRNAAELEKTYSQMHRLYLYNHALDSLRQNGRVYACNCSRTQVLSYSALGSYSGTCRNKKIPLDEKDVCWRLYTEPKEKIIVNTLNGRVYTAFPPMMHDFVVRKKDGFAAYQLSSLVDDLYFGVNLIVRGADLWPSTLAQLYLAKVQGEDKFMEVTFYHHALLKNTNGNKLSKSLGDTSIQSLMGQGKTVEQIYHAMNQLINNSPVLQSWKDITDFRSFETMPL